MSEHELWFAQPATAWIEALPLGNGVLGAMVFGGVQHERLQINDGTAWSGSPASEFAEPQIDPGVAADALAEARRAIGHRDFAKADEVLKRIQHRYSQTYLPFADVTIDLTLSGEPKASVAGYRRVLTLRDAVHRTEYRLNGHSVTHRTFVSAGAGVLVCEIQTDAPDGLDLVLGLDSPLRILEHRANAESVALLLKMPSDVTPRHDDAVEPISYSDDDTLSMQGSAALRWEHDGVTVQGSGPTASGVHHAVIYLATETTFVGLGLQPIGAAEDAYARASARVDRAAQLGAEAILAHHRVDHAALYDRVELEVGSVDTAAPASTLPVDERLRLGNAHTDGVLSHDPGLAALLFHYGRYLLISSSRSGGVPANLQGIWNESLQPPWSSNYTTNINLQMNYWMAEIGNLPECLPPLFELIDALVVTGTRTAKRLYAAPGWVAHHNTDVWAYSQPVGQGAHDPKWAFWPLAGAWLVRHLWERMLHGADDAFARDRAWAPIRSAAEFYLAWLVEQPDGALGTSPSTSPENQFRSENGVVGSVARSSAFDLVVIADLLGMLTALADRLGIEDDPVVAAARAARLRLAGPTIGRDGPIQEWADDFEYPDPLHRHVAHLYFVHPGDRAITPELARAASLSLDERGDESTGWSLAWKLLMRARLGQPQKTGDLLRLFFRDMTVDRGPWIGGLYPNMFAAHPPFQIDGNLGYVSGIAECLVQSHGGIVELLKAVPPELASGSVRGLVARPGIEVSLGWQPEGNEAERAGISKPAWLTLRTLVPSAAGERTLRWGGHEVVVTLEHGVELRLDSTVFDSDRTPQYT